MLSQVLTRKEQLVLLFLGGSICLGSIVLYSVSSPSETDPNSEVQVQQEILPKPAPDPSPEATLTEPDIVPDRVQVSVAGAVRRPGVYVFRDGGRVQDAIEASGGTEKWADINDINLAAHLIDGTTLTIPGEEIKDFEGPQTIRRPTPPPPNPAQYTVSGWSAETAGQAANFSVGAEPLAGGIIDLNRATAEELESLPGIGPKLAGEIIRFRAQQPFQSVDDLDLVSGIGPKRLEAIRSLVTVGQ